MRRELANGEATEYYWLNYKEASVIYHTTVNFFPKTDKW